MNAHDAEIFEENVDQVLLAAYLNHVRDERIFLQLENMRLQKKLKPQAERKRLRRGGIHTDLNE